MKMPYAAPQPLDCATIRACDERAIRQLGIPGLILMENAARGAAEVIHREWRTRSAGEVIILCGPGNNGGDGFAIARQLAAAGVEVCVVLAEPAEKLRGDAAVNFEILRNLGLRILHGHSEAIRTAHAPELNSAAVLVDALLGTGARGAPSDAIAYWVARANQAERPLKVAVDIPTGLDGDLGIPASPCFRADVTVTFLAEKVGFREKSAQSVLGRVEIVGLGVPLKNLLGGGNPA
jgi:NAD(P)H-hydrate epimerase